jgi:hypothetical protein
MLIFKVSGPKGNIIFKERIVEFKNGRVQTKEK